MANSEPSSQPGTSGAPATGAVPVAAGFPGAPVMPGTPNLPGTTTGVPVGPATTAEREAPAATAPPHTRASAIWTALAGVLVFIVVVVVFLLENLQDVRVTFFGVHWRAPLAVDLLLAVVLGGLLVFSAGAVRIVQVRLHGRRQRRSMKARQARPPGVPHASPSS